MSASQVKGRLPHQSGGSRAWKGGVRLAPATGIAGWRVPSDLMQNCLGRRSSRRQRGPSGSSETVNEGELHGAPGGDGETPRRP